MRKCLMQCFGIALTLICSMAALAEPAVYTLGTPLGQVADVDVDYSGRLLVMDYARQAVMRFDINGRLDSLYPYDDSIQTYNYHTGADIHVRPDYRILIAPGYAGGKVPVRLLDLDNGTCTGIAGTEWWIGVVALAGNDGFYAFLYGEGEDDRKLNYVQPSRWTANRANNGMCLQAPGTGSGMESLLPPTAASM